MHILLFGGSFNPPHLGHRIVTHQAFELIEGVDELWLLPDYQHSFAKNSKLASPQHRLAMCQLFIKNTPAPIKVSSIAIDHQMSGNTIEHITYLQKHYPKHKFSFLMGSDQLPSFTKWGSWQQLLKLLPFYIYPRPDFPFKPLQKNMHPLKSPNQIITNLSSTLIRNRLHKNLLISHLVPPAIAKYIRQNNLYS